LVHKSHHDQVGILPDIFHLKSSIWMNYDGVDEQYLYKKINIHIEKFDKWKIPN